MNHIYKSILISSGTQNQRRFLRHGNRGDLPVRPGPNAAAGGHFLPDLRGSGQNQRFPEFAERDERAEHGFPAEGGLPARRFVQHPDAAVPARSDQPAVAALQLLQVHGLDDLAAVRGVRDPVRGRPGARGEHHAGDHDPRGPRVRGGLRCAQTRAENDRRMVMFYDHTRSCRYKEDLKVGGQGHWERTEKDVDRFFYVSGSKPSNLPNAVVVSPEEAQFGSKAERGDGRYNLDSLN